MISWLKKLIVNGEGYQPIRKLDITNPPATKESDKFRIIERADGKIIVQHKLYLRIWVWSDISTHDNIEEATKTLNEIIAGKRNRFGEKIIIEKSIVGG